MGRRTITTKGMYTWNLVFSLENTGSMASTYKRTVKVSTRVCRSDCLRALQRCEQDMNGSMNTMSMSGVGGTPPFRLSSISTSCTMGYSFHQSCYNDMGKDSSKDVIIDNCQEMEEEYTIPPGAKARLYQLCFSGPGVEMRLSTLANNPEDIPPVMVTAVVEEFGGPVPLGKYAIRTCHGKHLTAPPEAGTQLMQQTHMKSWEKFTLVQAGGSDRYGIRTTHGTFLCAHPGTGESSKVDLQCDKHNWERMQWEQFTLVPVPSKEGCFGIRSSHGTFLCAHPDGKIVLQHDMHDWDKMQWEQFCLIAVD